MVTTEDSHVFVCRGLLGAPGVAHAGPDDARQRSEERIPRPEAAHAEGGAFAPELLQLARHSVERTDITLEDRTREVCAALVRRNGAIVRENGLNEAWQHNDNHAS